MSASPFLSAPHLLALPMCISPPGPGPLPFHSATVDRPWRHTGILPFVSVNFVPANFSEPLHLKPVPYHCFYSVPCCSTRRVALRPPGSTAGLWASPFTHPLFTAVLISDVYHVASYPCKFALCDLPECVTKEVAIHTRWQCPSEAACAAARSALHWTGTLAAFKGCGKGHRRVRCSAGS
jgi:hypothetical protein